MSRYALLKYRARLTALSTTPVSRPKTGPGNLSDVQMNDGMIGIRLGATRIAELYVKSVEGAIHEQLFVLDVASWINRTVVYEHLTPTIKSIPPERYADLKALEGDSPTAPFKLAKFDAVYLMFPEASAIAELPDTNPPIVKATYVHDVRYHQSGVTEAPITARLYREKVVANDKTSWNDHWVMYDTFYAAYGTSTLSTTPNVDPQRPTTLKQFLTAERARLDTLDATTQSKWKYAPVTYVLGPLPEKTPVQ